VLFRSLFTLFALAFASPAFAELPEPLAAALSANPNGRAPDGIVLRMSLGPESIRVAVGFEGGETPTYRLLEPNSEAQLSETQAEMWAGFDSGEETAPDADGAEPGPDGETQIAFGDYDPETIRESIGGSAVFDREENGQLVYAFTPLSLPSQGDSAPQGLLDHMRGEVFVDAGTNQLSVLRYSLAESFKPNLAARIETFDLEQRFVFEPALDGPRVAGVSMSMSGSALFQPFSQTMRFDIEEVRFGEAADAALETAAESP